MVQRCQAVENHQRLLSLDVAVSSVCLPSFRDTNSFHEAMRAYQNQSITKLLLDVRLANNT